MKSTSKTIYFTMLELENIRSFAGQQRLDLRDPKGRPAQWTLILGDNGVGKTTILQCLTRMRPQYNELDGEPSEQMPRPIEPELAQEEDNAVLKALARSGTDADASLTAELETGARFGGTARAKRRLISTHMTIRRKKGRIIDVEAGGECETRVEPLVLAYGAGRHRGVGNLEKLSEAGSTASLFDAAAELFDTEETLYRLDYIQLKEKGPRKKIASHKLKGLKALLAEILPYIDSPEDIDIRGPRLPGSKDDNGGVWVKTPFGTVPIADLSLGYQTVMAWTSDIAWRLLNHYPESPNPLLEPAIVIVDEIDLHLHPQWQRTIREHLTKHFPAVQFIATAHSPLMAQDALDTNLAVIRDIDGQATIVSDPAVVKTWRLDQIITSELFGLSSARGPDVERAMSRRVELSQKKVLSATEKAELSALDRFAHGLPTAEGDDQKAMDIIRQAADRLSRQTAS
ncbi:AAA family ATPase [Mesorhizobium dulcispinae]|uniref:AAA family ATPase n=1 Tax=Mesorhizobium dulcispinae TaxID=3072316 RepID=UPI002A24D4E5|nr:AAA family ATPase [Mesorhizobium sp. VK23D]MDX8522064.1 AAA family ATPase [Mesorhizobium sp. VK23D]